MTFSGLDGLYDISAEKGERKTYVFDVPTGLDEIKFEIIEFPSFTGDADLEVDAVLYKEVGLLLLNN